MIKLCCESLNVRCIWLYIFIMSHTSFRVNPYSIFCLNVKELLARIMDHIWSLSDSNEIRTHNHLVRCCHLNLNLESLNHWISLLSLKLQIWCLLRVRSSLTFRLTIECWFRPKLVRDKIMIYSRRNVF